MSNIKEKQICTLEEINSLFIQHKENLQSLCLRLTRNKFDADDLFSESYLRIIRYKHTFDKGTNFPGWCSRIALNVYFDSKTRGPKNKYHFVDYENHTEFHSTDNLANQNLLENDLNKSLNDLNINDKILFNLYRNGYKYKEIKDILKMPIGTVKTKLFRIKNKIGHDIKDYK